MIESSSEPALRAGFQRGGGVFQNLSRGGFQKFSILRGGLGIPPPPLAIPAIPPTRI